MIRKSVFAGTLVAIMAGASSAAAASFDAGSLIIPMDTTYQDEGMLKAFGLVYQLLLHDVPVHWVVGKTKSFGEADFVTDTQDYATAAPIVGHGYRGGPWVIDSAHAAAASPIIDAWQAAS